MSLRAVSRAAHVTRAIRAPSTLFARGIRSLEALKVVHSAQRNGTDAELALQAALEIDPPFQQLHHTMTALLPNGDTQDLEIEPDDAEIVVQEEPDMRLANVHLGPYPRLAAHALLHGHLREGRLLEASALAYTQLRHGVKIAPQSLEFIVDALCPPTSTLPGLAFNPTISINGVDSARVFGGALERMQRDMDLGTAMARVLVNTAREEQSPRSRFMYLRLIESAILQRKLATAASIYAMLCNDWQLHHELIRRQSSEGTSTEVPTNPPAPTTSMNAVADPLDEPTNDSLSAQPALESSGDATPSPTLNESAVAASGIPDPEYIPPFNSRDLAEARGLGLDNLKLKPPTPHRRLLSLVVRGVLAPESVDMKRPDRRFIGKPDWNRDAITAVFILIELVERRRVPVKDITPIVRLAAAALESGVHGVPVKIYRGGQLHRVKAQNHIESVIRTLMREPPTRPFHTGPWDLLLPLPLAAYNELLAFGLVRKVPVFELESLIDGIFEQGVQPNQSTIDILFQRARLSQNKMVDALIKKINSQPATQIALDEEQ